MIPLWNVEELEAVLPDDCRVERKSARIDVRRGRVTTRIMDNPTGGDGVLASRHTSYMDIDRIVLPEFDAKSIAAFVTGPLPQSERRLLRVEDYLTAIRDDGDTFRAGLRESMLGRWRSLCQLAFETIRRPCACVYPLARMRDGLRALRGRGEPALPAYGRHIGADFSEVKTKQRMEEDE